MPIQDNVNALGDFLKTLETGSRQRANTTEATFKTAKFHFEEIKKKLLEDAKTLDGLEKGTQKHKEETAKLSDADKGHSKYKKLQDLQKEIEDLKEENQKLKQENKDLLNRSGDEKLQLVYKVNDEKKRLQVEVEELSKRLSSVTSQQMTKSNPAIADLSDPYRPTKMVEKFGLLYDNQWTDAFSSFEKTKRKEDEVIQILSQIVKRADKFCTESFLQVTGRIRGYVTDDISNPKVAITKDGKDIICTPPLKVSIESTHADLLEGHINDLMKALAAVTGKQLADIFLKLPMDLVKKTFKTNETNGKQPLDIFAGEAVKIIWMMKVQQPPMELVWVDPDSKYDKQMFTFYVSKGESVAQCIWPAVLLHKDGPVMARGIVQGK